MKPAFILFSAVIAACPFVSRADSTTSVVTREYPVAAHGTLLVDINRANITIEPASTQVVRITAREHCTRAGSLTSPMLEVSVAHSLTHVHVSAEDNDFDTNARRAELVVQVPAGFNVRVRDGEGNIKIGKMGGLVDATTEYGTVRLDRSTRVAKTVATSPSIAVLE
jgi:hypothetical protein